MGWFYHSIINMLYIFIYNLTRCMLVHIDEMNGLNQLSFVLISIYMVTIICDERCKGGKK
jgi:hypothetical protein